MLLVVDKVCLSKRMEDGGWRMDEVKYVSRVVKSLQ